MKWTTDSFLFLLLVYSLVGCQQAAQQQQKQLDQKEVESETDSFNIFDDNSSAEKTMYQLVFPYVLDRTYESNPALFMQQLVDYYNIKAPFELQNVSVNSLYGSNNSVYFVQGASYSAVDSNCLYPCHRLQFIFNHEGKLIHKNTAKIARFIPFKGDSTALFMTVNTNCDGTGKHHFYKFQEGKLIDLYNVLMNESPVSYDANMQDGMMRHKVLNERMVDIDEDGWEDIVLKGEFIRSFRVTSTGDTIFRLKPVEYRFVYKPGKDFFHWQKND